MVFDAKFELHHQSAVVQQQLSCDCSGDRRVVMYLDADAIWQMTVACMEMKGINRVTKAPKPLPKRYTKTSHKA